MDSSAIGQLCPECGRTAAWRQVHRYPVLETLVFGGSFAAFLLLYSKLGSTPAALWSWSAVQVALGALLIRGRIRAKKRVLVCIHCKQALG